MHAGCASPPRRCGGGARRPGRAGEGDRRAGLRFLTGDHDLTLHIPIVDSAAGAGPFTHETAVLLCVKSQHTPPALGQLKAAGAGPTTSVVCGQNSIWNEPTAGRVFHHVNGMSTLIRATFLRPGLVLNPMSGTCGFIEIGRFLSGVDALDESLAEDFGRAGFAATTHSDVMLPKVASGFCAVRWEGPSILGHGDAGMPGVMRSARAAKLSVLTNP